MANVTQLANLASGALALSNLVLVTPQKTIGYQPQNAPNADGSVSTAKPPPALLFHYEGENNVNLQADITDHFVEDNTSIQDQIALKPDIVTVQGFIGELNNVVPDTLAPLKTAADKLTIIGAYTPALSTTALIAYNNAFALYQLADTAKNAAVSSWESLSNTGGQSVITGNTLTKQPNQNKQQVAFQQFYGYFKSRTLFTVQTPWAIFTNMAITNLRSTQDQDTRVITMFELTFKQMRFANTLVVNSAAFQARAASQAGEVVDNGPQTPPPSPISFNDALTGGAP